VGREWIYLIASKNPSYKVENLYQNLQKARQQQNMKQAKEVQMQLTKNFIPRGVEAIVPDKVIEVPWEDSKAIFSVLSNRSFGLFKSFSLFSS